MTASTITDVIQLHQQRLATIDPLLPSTHPLPEQQPGDEPLAAPGAAALLRHELPDPASLLATWGAASQYRLLPRIGQADPAAAMSALLDQWARWVHGQVRAGDPETEATVTWPSRDTVMTRTFQGHGLTPSLVIAARPAGRGMPTTSGEVQVRRVREDDLAVAGQLWLEEVRWDAQFGSATERPSTADRIAERLREGLTADPLWTWVAEVDGELAGLLVLDSPEQAGWVAPLVSTAPAAYLTCLVVTGRARGAGVGAALVRQAHAALDAAEVSVTLLHYAALNPLSAPFWHRCGYRPLWTTWQARPASDLRVTE
ncbi:GNAT family N-acetyltransferase [Natronosporangium hydrolyticum]|uniref:GNAT family N-acetyltransferase n=1 Tax=Natronosporangium hydrolyticum TaxID=2811111 RepID=A0A895YEH0_9ACTN|nr:GNAT family N-acetyltransferase [Natronosporangium hydrolyticum]QSB12620.1 GNAT family N-acetyltransferase [Natronosporangium hydrolyticum]